LYLFSTRNPEKGVGCVDITARSNPSVARMRRLLRDAGYRRECGLFALEGARLCGDAALSGVPVEEVLYTEKAAASYAVQLGYLRDTGAPCREISGELAAYIGDTASPQGLFCACRFPDNSRPLSSPLANGRYIALEDMQDPANLGTVIRTAEALGLDGLILSSGCCDIFNPKVLRGSMGGVFRLPFYHTSSMADAVRLLQAGGLSAFACVVDADAEPVHTLSFAKGGVCVIGNEGNGLRAETVAACAHRVTIRMMGRAESLNASMAAGLVMWEMMRPEEG
jgi:TrmH family RNA methyltransferase